MATFEDKMVGTLFLAVSIFVFGYYTIWVLIMPFVQEGHFLQAFFPDRYYAILVPVLLLVTALSVVGLFLGTMLLKSAQKKKLKST